MIRHCGLLPLLLMLPSLARADMATDAAQCQAAGGSFLAGTVTNGPRFRGGERRDGIHLSHTHVTLSGDDGTSYDVAIDNVFANGYRRNQASVPAPLASIRVGERLELCGKLYASGDAGIDWVHTNCGEPPTPEKPDGWVREVDASGNPGTNMEANQAYCGLWPN